MCIKDLKELQLEIDDITLMTKNELKKNLKELISESAFKHLTKKKDQQSKGRQIHFPKFEMQNIFQQKVDYH